MLTKPFLQGVTIVFTVAGAAYLGESVSLADPAPGPLPVLPGITTSPLQSPVPLSGVYGETLSGGGNSPRLGAPPGFVPGALAPQANEISLGTSGIRPGTNVQVPGSQVGLPVPDFPANRFSSPPAKLPGQP